MTLATLTGTQVATVALGAVVLWTVASFLVATYGQGRGFRFWPLFISAWFLGFPLVLLGITLAAELVPREHLGRDWVAADPSETPDS